MSSSPHTRGRGVEKFPLVSPLAGRRVSDSRVFVSSWLKTHQRTWIVAPEPSPEVALGVYSHWYSLASVKDGSSQRGADQPWLVAWGCGCHCRAGVAYWASTASHFTSAAGDQTLIKYHLIPDVGELRAYA